MVAHLKYVIMLLVAITTVDCFKYEPTKLPGNDLQITTLACSIVDERIVLTPIYLNAKPFINVGMVYKNKAKVNAIFQKFTGCTKKTVMLSSSISCKTLSVYDNNTYDIRLTYDNGSYLNLSDPFTPSTYRRQCTIGKPKVILVKQVASNSISITVTGKIKAVMKVTDPNLETFQFPCKLKKSINKCTASGLIPATKYKICVTETVELFQTYTTCIDSATKSEPTKLPGNDLQITTLACSIVDERIILTPIYLHTKPFINVGMVYKNKAKVNALFQKFTGCTKKTVMLSSSISCKTLSVYDNNTYDIRLIYGNGSYLNLSDPFTPSTYRRQCTTGKPKVILVKQVASNSISITVTGKIKAVMKVTDPNLETFQFPCKLKKSIYKCTASGLIPATKYKICVTETMELFQTYTTCIDSATKSGPSESPKNKTTAETPKTPFSWKKWMNLIPKSFIMINGTSASGNSTKGPVKGISTSSPFTKTLTGKNETNTMVPTREKTIPTKKSQTSQGTESLKTGEATAKKATSTSESKEPTLTTMTSKSESSGTTNPIDLTTGTTITTQSTTKKPVTLKNVACSTKDDFIYLTATYVKNKQDEDKVKMLYQKISYFGKSLKPKPFITCTTKKTVNESAITCKAMKVLDYYAYKIILKMGEFELVLKKSFRPVEAFKDCKIEAYLDLHSTNIKNNSITVVANVSKSTMIMEYGITMKTSDKVSTVSNDLCKRKSLTTFDCFADKLEPCNAYSACVTIRLTYILKKTECLNITTAGCKKVIVSAKIPSYASSKDQIAIALGVVCVLLAIAVGAIVWWKQPMRSSFLPSSKRLQYTNFENSEDVTNESMTLTSFKKY